MRVFLFIAITILTLSCQQTTTDNTYIETVPSFQSLHNGDLLTNNWIRNPEKLLMIHETFKSFGYEKLLANFISSEEFLYQDIYIKRPFKVLLDSLEKTYNVSDINSKYYKEFWQRRKKEDIDSVVYIILKDIKNILYDNRSITKTTINKSLVNDTLSTLLKIEFSPKQITDQQALQNFEALKDLEFHQSAYNLLYERYDYYDIKWNKEELKKLLIKSDKDTNAWFEDNTK